MIKVLHLGCGHEVNDPRIRKECRSLADTGKYQVTYITSAESKQSNASEDDGVIVKQIETDRRGIYISRDLITFQKYRRENKRIVMKAIMDECPDILHVHEFELMYMIRDIRKKMPHLKVVYDTHENNPDSYYDICFRNSHEKLAPFARAFVRTRERKYVRNADAVIATTQLQVRALKAFRDDIDMVCNFPVLQHSDHVHDWNHDSKPQVCYCGLLTESRIGAVLSAADQIRADIVLAGVDGEGIIEKYQIEKRDNVKYLGVLSPKEVWDVYDRSSVGICVLGKCMNNNTAYPTKVFEYMLAGIPIVYNDFPACREILSDAKCGILVDPENKAEITDAINYLLDNRTDSERMGNNGRKAAIEKYNWSIESQKLNSVYQRLST